MRDVSSVNISDDGTAASAHSQHTATQHTATQHSASSHSQHTATSQHTPSTSRNADGPSEGSPINSQPPGQQSQSQSSGAAPDVTINRDELRELLETMERLQEAVVSEVNESMSGQAAEEENSQVSSYIVFTV